MIGSKVLRLSSENELYELVLDRTYTHIVGESGTGKTLLVDCLVAYFNKDDDSIELDCDVKVVVIETIGELISKCDASKECIYVLDENVCESLNRRATSIARESYEYLNTMLSKCKKGEFPNAYFIFMTRSPVVSVNIDIMSIYEIVSDWEDGRLIKRLSYVCTWENKPKVSVDLALIEGTGSDYLFFKNSLYDCDVVPCGGKNNIARYLLASLNSGYTSILVFADGASFGYNLLLNEELFSSLIGGSRLDVRLYFPNSFEWLILASGLFSVDRGVLENPENYFNTTEYSGIEQFFTDFLSSVVKDPSTRNYKFSAISPKGYEYYPERLVYTKKGSKSGYNHFVDVVLLSRQGVQNIYNLIGEVENYTENVPMINYRKCKNLPITSEKGKRLLKEIRDLIKNKN